MAYIFLSFSEHLNKTGNSKIEFYNLSLLEQYELLQKRVPLERQVKLFSSFIETCFPTGLKKKYYISCPNFLREKKQVAEDRPSYLNNVVIRPELTLSMRNVLPNNQNVILIGDIFEHGKLRMLQIKGIQFIDASMSSPNDLVSDEMVCNSFERNSWSVQHVDYNDTFFTPNKVAEIISSCFTVNSPGEVRQTYQKWEKYINFRKYYLDEQSKRNFLLDSVKYIEAYAVNRKDYKKNSSIYDDYILDNLTEFTRGDMVVLSNKIEDAEPFPLIRLNIDRNKKEFYAAKILKRGKLVNEEERKIRSLSSDNVFITSIDPASYSNQRDKNGDLKRVTFGEMLNLGYALGDRFKLVSFDIPPEEHLNQLQEKYEKEIVVYYKNIDNKYEKIIDNELNKSADLYEKELVKNILKEVQVKGDLLKENLSTDVEENKDQSILSQIKILKADIKNHILKDVKKEKGESDQEYKLRLDAIIERECKDIDIKQLYVERNNTIVHEYETSLINKAKKEVASRTPYI